MDQTVLFAGFFTNRTARSAETEKYEVSELWGGNASGGLEEIRSR